MLTWEEIRELLYYLAVSFLTIYGMVTIPALIVFAIAAYQQRHRHAKRYSLTTVLASFLDVACHPLSFWKEMKG